MEKSEKEIIDKYSYPIGSKVVVEYFHIYKDKSGPIKIIDDEFEGILEFNYPYYLLIKCFGKNGEFTKTVLKKDLYLGVCKIKIIN